MKKLLIALCGLAVVAGCTKPANNGDNNDGSSSDNKVIETPAFAKGADVSWLSEMEANGKTFKKKDGTTADCFEVLKDCGVNSIRLRVWVNPTGGWSDKKDMVGLAQRAAKAGMALMVDFHYSDFFCDPSRQDIPRAWAADKADVNKMCVHVKEHTTEVLEALKAVGVTPAWIQIGNETRNGFLWPIGQLWGNGAGGNEKFADLYKAGYNAAKAVFPSALVGPHVNNAYDDNDWWFKDRKASGCKFDMICLSHYPQAQTKMTPAECNTAAVSRIKALIGTYNVPVIVSEVGVKTPDNETEAANILQEFMTAVKQISSCKGVFYWEPEVYDWWKPSVYSSLGWNSYNMGAFLSGGRPSKVMDALCN